MDASHLDRGNPYNSNISAGFKLKASSWAFWAVQHGLDPSSDLFHLRLTPQPCQWWPQTPTVSYVFIISEGGAEEGWGRIHLSSVYFIFSLICSHLTQTCSLSYVQEQNYTVRVWKRIVNFKQVHHTGRCWCWALPLPPGAVGLPGVHFRDHSSKSLAKLVRIKEMLLGLTRACHAPILSDFPLNV